MIKKLKEIKEAIKFLKLFKKKDSNIMLVSFFGEFHYCKINSIRRDINGQIDVESTEIDILSEVANED
ncbi:hypothetical protein [Streptococcus iniae]|uniref:hypothetical protein n=1 Tax=Streptococcus iniae TaxID=1346 RepID=UPI0003348149|nr:hypothetical protein [Streptococcus iniae]AGM99830.1 hypothetical protein K710_2088 [Streptococcus iniae SF1]QBX25767.1 hypothetical protein Javan272_0018 [Streptococcus phage Javan272]ASL35722.1 hypothetical protein QMA0248_1954 [Streptococcus iniae]ELY5748922.1 hypothetical protein [Streptococcus iniae]ELY5750856.1 hypothetical protein [Streptococcus iniae]